jgi:hypothetical protein
MAVPARHRDPTAVRRLLILVTAILAACASGPQPLDWQLNARQAMEGFQRLYFAGEPRLAETEFARARSELARTGRADVVARAELLRCALRTASLEFDDCAGFAALRADAGAPERAYADYLAGRATRSASDEPLSRLVAAALQLRAGSITPAGIAAAVDAASAQGWRRPLLAWLGVQAKRAEDAGDAEAAARIRRRMDLVTVR